MTVGHEKIRCLIDTGSSTTLLNSNKLKSHKRRSIKKSIVFNTLNNTIHIDKEIQTMLPIEFNKDAEMIWKLTKFNNKMFDAIIGQNH